MKTRSRSQPSETTSPATGSPATAHPTMASTTTASPASISSNGNMADAAPPVHSVRDENNPAVCDLSDITVSTQMTLTEAKLQIQLLVAKNRELSENLIIHRNHVEDLSDKLGHANMHLERSYKNAPKGKNTFRKRLREALHEDHPEDQMNVIYINEVVSKIFKGHKFKPNGFHNWSNDPGSFCHTITSNGNIGWPREFPKERYWDENIVPMINAKYCNLVNNATQKLRARYISTYSERTHCISLIFNSRKNCFCCHFIGDFKSNITLTLNLNRIFSNKNPEDSTVADYIRFLVRYTSLIIGKRKIVSAFKKQKGIDIFDILLPSDEAFAIVIYENNKEKWESQAKKIMKISEVEANDFGENDGEEPSSSPAKKPKWTGVRAGKKNAYLQDNWSESGKKRYQEIGRIIQECRSSGEVHDAHVAAWNIYNAKYKFAPVPKQASDNTDDETASTTDNTAESMPPLQVPILKMVNGKFDFANVFD